MPGLRLSLWVSWKPEPGWFAGQTLAYTLFNQTHWPLVI
jgi:hypothetical protein